MKASIRFVRFRLPFFFIFVFSLSSRGGENDGVVRVFSSSPQTSLFPQYLRSRAGISRRNGGGGSARKITTTIIV
jgi:hypothetical protein